MVKALAYAVAVAILTITLLYVQKSSYCDARVYYEAGRGNFVGKELVCDNGVKVWWGWLYADPLRWVFWPLAQLSWEVFRSVVFAVNALSLFHLTRRLTDATRYAAVVLALASEPLTQFMGGANLHITLLALCLNPWGAALACACKPYLFVFVLLHWWVIFHKGGSR